MFLVKNSPFSPSVCVLEGDTVSLSFLLPLSASVPRLLFATEADKQKSARSKYEMRLETMFSEYNYVS